MNFLTAQWRNLIMANYEVEESVLTPFLPLGLTLDTHEDRHFISLVGFQFVNTRVMGIKWPGLHTFVELNLRFYVKRTMPDGDIRRGVVFIKEIVPSHLISFVVRVVYHEPYECWDISPILEFGIDHRVGYKWKKSGNQYRLEVLCDPNQTDLVPNSHEQFIAEHYWGYTKLETRTNEYEVKHPSWQYYPAQEYVIECDFSAVYGAQWSFLNEQEPYSVFVAEGSDISAAPKQSFA